ncbi:OmpA family protein [Enterobacter cloacae]|uniref:OmpA family protein n=1 Tax=Enterobacter cloacae TaxID=550 RepID=UPI0034A4F375|nr:OmpA family protein [Enterobacter cloacae]
MTFFKTSLFAALFTTSAFVIHPALAAENFGKTYQPVAPVGQTQTQVVYYRDASNTAGGAAHIYVDNEFHDALLPGGYTVFCLAPGKHNLGAYQNDAPQYRGKEQGYNVEMSGGQTYFVRVSSTMNSVPEARTREQAEKDLAGLREQTHVLSRASSVEACKNLAPQYKDYTLSGDVMFRFGKGNEKGVSAQGRQAVKDLVATIKRENVELKQIQVIGHTDAIGSDRSNYALGLKRAQTVRTMLAENGLPARLMTATSVGSNEPVVNDCDASNKSALISCLSPNRRVVVRVSGDQNVTAPAQK